MCCNLQIFLTCSQPAGTQSNLSALTRVGVEFEVQMFPVPAQQLFYVWWLLKAQQRLVVCVTASESYLSFHMKARGSVLKVT